MLTYQQYTYTALRRQLSTKKKEPWKDLSFYTTIDLTTSLWMLPKHSRTYRPTLHMENSRTPKSTTYQKHTQI